jgi:hypothetical protein
MVSPVARMIPATSRDCCASAATSAATTTGKSVYHATSPGSLVAEIFVYLDLLDYLMNVISTLAVNVAEWLLMRSLAARI